MERFEVITGPERRRRWSDEQKQAIVAESLMPGAVVTAVARRAGICPGQIYRWRQEIGAADSGFAEVIVAPAATGAVCSTAPAIEIAFSGKAHVRIAASASAELASAVIKALSRR